MKRLFWAFVLLMAPVVTAGVTEPSTDKKIHECTDAQGNVVFQDEPCAEPAPAVHTPPAAAPRAAKAKPPAKPKPLVKVKPAAVTKPPTTAKPPVMFQVPETPKAHPKAPLPPPIDVNGVTPERALQTFVAAVKAGDRAAVFSSLTSLALDELGPDAEALPMDELRKTVESFTGYASEGDVGPFWAIRALRAGKRPKWVFLEKTSQGEWKIGGF